MGERSLRVVSLWVRPGQEAAFEDFERKAARIMARHGGRIDCAVRPAPGAGEDAPFEVHIVSFPDEAAYAAFRSDPDRLALADQRERIIARHLILAGREAGPYGPDA